ncbi:NAD(P)-dependent oxidoreductase [Aneurinibacillus sp. Ricciae_BoGa-3]|uniref:NAD(P)-dependent oxidoreductase n=1 Tax=Aneurinibacillus sp. Ricciae_BoGa-3 TaxID=3022697 RepID=UPI002341177D|nr:NAD(P)-dependent oxidoreductase [Aneurinibacillus sp. Ricciae_BoGa-3]WCK53235.1 NAD(P)-dependent oxidoreductase [Aneurinibacillus sp. Ricciae_BoGa-3]
MKRIGFIGIGLMGSGMAKNLLSAGYPLVVWNRTKSKAEELLTRGALWAGSPSDVARQADVVFTMLSADQQVKEVLLGAGGVCEAVHQGHIIIDSSTVSPKTSRELYEAFAAKGADFLDAPVTGSAPQAEAGNLGFMVGGKKEVFEACVPMFQAMGHSWTYMGETGAGTTTKLANNTMSAINLLSFIEGLTIARQGGINPEDFVKVVSSGGAHSKMVENKADLILSGNTAAQFASVLMNKDLGLALQMAEELGVAAPVLGIAKQILRMAVGKGFGEEDIAAIYKLYQDWA